MNLDRGLLILYSWVPAFEALDGDDAKALLLALVRRQRDGTPLPEFEGLKGTFAKMIEPTIQQRLDGQIGGRNAHNRQDTDAGASIGGSVGASIDPINASKDKISKVKNKVKNTTVPPSSPPKGEDAQIGGRFERFWAAYPKKVAKAAALKAWKSLSPDEGLLETILDALERQKKSDQWRRENGQFIPNPSTWINGKRWNDELTPRNSRYCESTDDSELLTIQC